MTASPLRYSPSNGGFYHLAMNGTIPADAVVITGKRHRELLAGQAAGRTIVAGADGRPDLAPIRKPTKTTLLAASVAGVKVEARARILAIASLERQANDNAAIAMRATMAPGKQLTDAELAGIEAAITRRRRIDAVRAASNALEEKIGAWSAAALSRFDPSADALWPGED